MILHASSWEFDPEGDLTDGFYHKTLYLNAKECGMAYVYYTPSPFEREDYRSKFVTTVSIDGKLSELAHLESFEEFSWKTGVTVDDMCKFLCAKLDLELEEAGFKLLDNKFSLMR